MGRLSLTIWLYISATAGVAAAVLAHAPVDSYPSRWWAVYAILAVLFLVCDAAPTPLAGRRSAWSSNSAATLAAVVLLGGFGAAMVGATAALSIRRVPIAGRLFNAAMYALAGYAAGAAYMAAGGHAPIAVPDRLSALTVPAGHVGTAIASGSILRPFAAAAIAHVLVNDGLLYGVLLIDRHNRPAAARMMLGSSIPLLLASDFGFAALGLVIVALWLVIGPFAAAIVLVPLFVARWAMGQFAEQQRAHSATMAALCQAVETKDLRTRGHSERVSRGARMIARQLGMRADRAEAVTIAGMLHDVGKLGVPTRVLQKEGPLTDEEYAAIQLHPKRGLEIVGEIGFLTEALTGIMHHHERFDGRGYPMGFAGDRIPEFARIIAVADAFDSITSDRSYHQARPIYEATAELRKGAGSQFDPKMVDAFIVALNREGWLPPEPGQRRAHEILTATGHDDPASPSHVADD